MEQALTGLSLEDEVALRQYLAQRLPNLSQDKPLKVERVGEGHSNLTFLVEFASKIAGKPTETLILRRPPPGPLLPSTHDMQREYAFLTALTNSSVPVPRPFWFCQDTSILGVHFYLMEYLAGVVIQSTLPPAMDNPAGRTALAQATIEVLAAIHKLDYLAVGLGNLGKPAGYLERQIRRRTEQLNQTIPHTRPLPIMQKVAEWLRDHQPASTRATIVHGDFRVGNLLFATDLPARVLGVLDWETATIGDPLVDLGYLLAFWPEAGEPPLPLGLNQFEAVEGFPTRSDLTESYEQLTHQKTERLNFYQAFSLWKLAISLEGSYARHLAGQSDDPFFASLKEVVPALAERAWALALL